MTSFKKILIITLFLLYFTILSLTTPKSVGAQTILFKDDFNDGNANGWAIIGSSGWNVTNNEYGILLNPGLSNTLPDNSLWNFSWTNITYTVDIRGEQGVDRNILVKFKDTSNFIELHANANGMFLEKASTSGGSGMIASTSLTLADNVNYHFRFDIINNESIVVYLNGIFLFSGNESLPLLTNWKVGLRAGTGGVPVTEVWFDNVLVTELDPFPPTLPPSPTPSPTPTPTPSPTPTPIATIGPFELPIEYPGRPATDPDQFKSAFWSKLNAAFDHLFQTGFFEPFTGALYLPTDCPSGTVGIICYDSHNGTDFSRTNSTNVLSVATGTIYYASAHNFSSCTPEKGGFGCVVIVGYPGNIFGLYAHLSKINVIEGQPVNQDSLLGIMGETGCPGCGVHLHFGVLKPTGAFALASPFMTKKDWQGLLSNIKGDSSKGYKPSCTYRAPNGIQFSFQDPSGWKGNGTDPWSLPKSQGGCAVNSPYLWKFDIGANP